MSEGDLILSKYKPYTLKGFYLEEHTSKIIDTLFELDDLNILFIGASGSGKTTLLNAIIREYYNLSKTSSMPHSNILFINNLKEQGIHYFRNEMKTFCQSQSNVRGKKKIVIIDDIDTINEQSQQVFRNYIDKYKRNIHFISVCNNIQKVNESIQSRTHILKLAPPEKYQIKELMDLIVKNENLEMDEASKEYVLGMCDGSFRVLINCLEKIYILGEPINIDMCMKLFSNVCFKSFEEYIHHLKKNELKKSIEKLYSVYCKGYSVIDILDFFFIFIKQTTSLDEKIKYQIIPFLCEYITITNKIHEDAIELALFTNDILPLFE